jgi:hypothetical protein
MNMNFNKEISPYLSGESFTSAYTLKISDNHTKLHNRIDLIAGICQKKSVIHLGFADHINLIETKISKNKWLHKRILDVAGQCVGIDIDEEAVQYVSQNLGIKDVYRYDLVNEPPMDILLQHRWDIMVMGEIIEHIDNPQIFLASIREKYGNVVDKLVITAPNSFRYRNVKAFINREEYINSDHRFWFTPYTLAKIAVRAGWYPQSFEYADGTGYPMRLLYRLFPVLGDTLVMMLSSKPNDF